MTLLEDLEASAKVADASAGQCDALGRPDDAAACRTFADRQRGHARLLKDELAYQQQMADAGNDFSECTLLGLERINGGPR